MPKSPQSPITFVQSSFSGGLRRSVDPTKLSLDEYALLVNGRSRYGTIKPVKNPLQVTAGLPSSGIVQNITGAGSILVVFIAGKAYYKDFNSTVNVFSNIPGFQMSASANTLWTELVPAATTKLKRIPIDGTNKNSGVNFTDFISGTPAALVVQDGESQPSAIYPDSSYSVLQTWAQWTDTNREYVPVGTKMMFSRGKLYVVSKDNKEIYHSVTGRPLDFMVPIDDTGNKFGTEEESGAPAVSHRVDYDDITAISRLNLGNGGFFVTTAKNSFSVTPDFSSTIYGEPQFNNTFLFTTGALNQFSIVDILGDTALIDFAGVRSFNAVSQLAVEGNNAPFSADVFPFFEGVIQSITCAISFDNYALFSVTTIYGPGILVYDTLLKKFSALDIYEDVGLIKQFCEIKLPTARKLFFITTDNKVYEAFSSTTTATCRLYTREFSASDLDSGPFVEFTPISCRAAFLDSKESGVAFCTFFVDRFSMTKLQQTLTATNPTGSSTDLPFGVSSNDTTQSLTFSPQSRKRGYKIGAFIEWSSDCELVSLALQASPFSNEVSIEQGGTYYKS